MEDVYEPRDLEELMGIHIALAEKHGFEVGCIGFAPTMSYRLMSYEPLMMIGDFSFPPELFIQHSGEDDDNPEYVVVLDMYLDKFFWDALDADRDVKRTSSKNMRLYTDKLLELRNRLIQYHGFQGGETNKFSIFFYVPGVNERDTTELDKFMGLVSEYLAELRR
ncbi:hypothetical protein KY363_05210 [Candidatus Woesearchaeota archaeon]|nr:hypothetical protein [Candidatus Woesearchaeota archaeon]